MKKPPRIVDKAVKKSMATTVTTTSRRMNTILTTRSLPTDRRIARAKIPRMTRKKKAVPNLMKRKKKAVPNLMKRKKKAVPNLMKRIQLWNPMTGAKRILTDHGSFLMSSLLPANPTLKQLQTSRERLNVFGSSSESDEPDDSGETS
jgi:hypothetical protein